MAKESPCHFCQSRYVGCHSPECAAWVRYQKALEEDKELIAKDKAKREVVTERARSKYKMRGER